MQLQNVKAIVKGAKPSWKATIFSSQLSRFGQIAEIKK
jgi:hypothetical protein